MKLRSLAFILPLLVSSVSFAQAEPTPSAVPDFGSHWLKSPWIDTHTSAGDYRARAFMRLVQTEHHSYPVGSVTYFKYPKGAATEPFSYAQVLDTLREGMGIPHWIERDVERAHVYEGRWAPLNRFIQVYVRENSDSVEYSVAMLRMSYLLPTGVEAEVLQRQLFGVMPKSSDPSWLQGITASLDRVETLFLNQAEAANGCDCSGVAVLSNPACAPTCLGGGSTGGGTTPNGLVITSNSNVNVGGAVQVNANQGQVNQVVSAGQGLSATGQNLTNAVSTQGGAANANWANTNTQLASFSRTLSSYEPTLQSLNSSAQAYDQDWKSTNQEFSRMVSLMQKEMQPGHLFITAGATAAGAVIGSNIASMAIQGITFGVKAFLEKVGVIKKESDILKVQHFKELRETYEKSKDAAIVLQGAIDSTLMQLGLVSKFGLSNEQILGQLGPEMALVSAKLDLAKENLKKDLLNGSSCQQSDSELVYGLTQELSNYDAIKSKMGNDGSQACRNLTSKLDQIVEAERDLQDMNLSMQDPEMRKAVLQAQDELNEKDHKLVQRVSQDQVADKSASLALKDAAREHARIDQEIEAKEKSLADRCANRVEGYLAGHPSALGKRGGSSGNVRKICRDFVRNHEEKVQDFLANFSAAEDQERMRSILDGAQVLSDLNQLDTQAKLSQGADARARRDIDSARTDEKRMNPSTNLSAEASEGGLASLNGYFEKLKLDQSDTDLMKKLASDHERIEAVCGADPVGMKLDQRARASGATVRQ